MFSLLLCTIPVYILKTLYLFQSSFTYVIPLDYHKVPMMWKGQVGALFEQEENWSLRLNSTVKPHSESMVEPDKGSKALIQSSVYLLLCCTF